MSKNDDNEEKLNFKLRTLEAIYDRQHYFIDRHEVMAEKILTALMITGGLVSIVLTLLPRPSFNPIVLWSFVIIESLFFVFFLLSFYLVLQAIRPLSSKALKAFDEKLLPKIGKPWVKASLIYHRGILRFINDCLSGGKDPVKEYDESITTDNVINDYIKQIFILSYYSNYKRVQLERATKFTALTIILGITSLVITLILIPFTPTHVPDPLLLLLPH